MYKSNELKEDLAQRQRTITYSGLGSHDQNGIDRRGTPTVVNSAKIMTLHQPFMWTRHFDMGLSPFTLSHSAYLWKKLSERQIISSQHRLMI